MINLQGLPSPVPTNTTITAENLGPLSEILDDRLQIEVPTYAAGAANISELLAFVKSASKPEKKIVKKTIQRRRDDWVRTKYRMMIGTRREVDAPMTALSFAALRMRPSDAYLT